MWIKSFGKIRKECPFQKNTYGIIREVISATGAVNT